MPDSVILEEEIKSRMVQHIQAYPGNEIVAAVWQGYIAGLLEWGLLNVEGHSRLVDLLPQAGRHEASAALLGPETSFLP